MRRWIVVLMALGLAACAEEFVGDVPDAAPDMEPLVLCAEVGGIDTMAKLEALSGCEEVTSLNIFGPEIVSLEPLRKLRRVDVLRVTGSSIRTVEPLRDLSDVVANVVFTENEFMDNCELTAWIAGVKKRDPNGQFGVTLDVGKNPEQCTEWPF